MSSMRFDVKFQERNSAFAAQFGEVSEVSDGGFERGYAEGYGKAAATITQFIDGTITEISDHSAKTVRGQAFYRLSALLKVDLPKVEQIGNGAFYGCNALIAVAFPALTWIDSTGFYNCRTLQKVDLGVVAYIGASCFNACYQLDTIIIRKTDGVCEMVNANAIGGTKIAGGTGYIYVPAALVEQYKAATNWSTYAAQIRAIEDYPEITGGES